MEEITFIFYSSTTKKKLKIVYKVNGELYMYVNFLNCKINKEQMENFIMKFKDGEILGIAIFEFHNEQEFRIYIHKENEVDTMLSVKQE